MTTKITFVLLTCERTGAVSLAVQEGPLGCFNLTNKGGPIWDEGQKFTVDAKDLERFVQPKLAEENRRLRKVLVRLYQACEPVRRWFQMRYVDATAKSLATPLKPSMLRDSHVMLEPGCPAGNPVTTAQLKELHHASDEVKEESRKWLA